MSKFDPERRFSPRQNARQIGFLLALLMAPAVGLGADAAHRMPRNPSSAKECAICHYRWVDTFFLDGRSTSLAPLQTDQVEGTADMCFSCHDGSVMDSRWAFEKEHGHRIGVPLPAGIARSEELPLDTNGNLRCVTCHSPHSIPSVLSEGTSTFLRINNTNSAMCLLCHPAYSGNSAGANHPIGPVTNTVPRELWTRHSQPETASHLITCETCHTTHGDPAEHLLAKPASDSSLCLTCHADKSPFNPDGTRNYFHVVNVVPTNAVIASIIFTNGAKLGRNGTITCLTCHKVHRNNIEKHLLVARLDAQSSFCFNCHASKQELNKNKHNLALSLPNARNLAGKTVAESGPCSACHLPHQNAQALAGKSDPLAGLCLACHGAKGLATSTNLLGRSHPIGVGLTNSAPSSKAGLAKPARLPLFDAHRFRSADGNMTCLTCHDVHKAQPDGFPMERPLFLRASVGRLCQECHTNQAPVLNTKHDLVLTGRDVRNAQGHTVAESGSCSACHLVHSATDSTWARAWPHGPTPTEKCQSCHERGGPGEKKGVGANSHPVDVAFKQAGQKTSLPLYAANIPTNTPAKVTCVTCHDSHRWSPTSDASPGHLVEGGRQDSFLRLPAGVTPRLCADCHPQEALVVRTEHDLSSFAPLSTNLVGQTASASGPCGACHATHNAPTKASLWARDLKTPTPGTPLVDAMCESCHAVGSALAANKVPEFAYHPPVTMANLPASMQQDRGFTTIVDPASGKVVNTGAISCATCHNVHRWSFREATQGPGVNIEGDANNSFLRHRSSEVSCKVCHGPDSIYRYQYFHKSTTHPSRVAATNSVSNP